ncbi:unnamed protein product [Adineta steineri]|uniref:Uncharacterized protein n=1 Tax=Adineta steineri TaxID=433720 RepID=A0A818K8B9_9BILA|nr:unnamed protein product [Adineta steineri]CAF3552150.1 unnamed protein product [Adineta steineri]
MGLWLKKEVYFVSLIDTNHVYSIVLSRASSIITKLIQRVNGKTKERSFQAPFTIKAHTLLHTHLHRLDTLILFYFYYNDIAVQFSAMGHTAGFFDDDDEGEHIIITAGVFIILTVHEHRKNISTIFNKDMNEE